MALFKDNFSLRLEEFVGNMARCFCFWSRLSFGSRTLALGTRLFSAHGSRLFSAHGSWLFWALGSQLFLALLRSQISALGLRLSALQALRHLLSALALGRPSALSSQVSALSSSLGCRLFYALGSVYSSQWGPQPSALSSRLFSALSSRLSALLGSQLLAPRLSAKPRALSALGSWLCSRIFHFGL